MSKCRIGNSWRNSSFAEVRMSSYWFAEWKTSSIVDKQQCTYILINIERVSKYSVTILGLRVVTCWSWAWKNRTSPFKWVGLGSPLATCSVYGDFTCSIYTVNNLCLFNYMYQWCRNASSVGCASAWCADGRWFEPQVRRNILSWRFGHEKLSTANSSRAVVSYWQKDVH